MKKILKKHLVRKKKALKKAAAKRRAFVSHDSKDEKAVLKILYRVSKNAKERAQRHNAPVTVIRGGRIIKVYPGKKQKDIGKAKPQTAVRIASPIKIK